MHTELYFRATTLKEVLQGYRDSFPNDKNANLVNVTREDVLQGLLRAFKRKSFDPEAALSIRFMGEDGSDQGGLRAECITLAYRQIAESKSICQGDNDGKLLVKDQIGKEHFEWPNHF